ncbi:MAG: hypothetical protein KC582_03850 [Candidatus Magasanikbacteria bacterium]|nr:hypothetical protein [Candidatus Magasanikbacteria bacterium]MCA9389633.1 hypothetical protein [Candidatus Magasanikbacteria bacterium]MCA9391362.1 hypothetical protein [Candidatus Magasanikbacteria bacterium]USN52170.1 MAG: hypothetical protein H6759_04005 [Candidatus Nomurabacteria bacterium]HPF94992.1 hypothetical protein [bacterium]
MPTPFQLPEDEQSTSIEEKQEDVFSDTEVSSDEPKGMSAIETKLALAQRVIRSVKEQIDTLERLLESRAEAADVEKLLAEAKEFEISFEGKSIDGVFDGENMVGEDGNPYPVPPNYASKSKLVEGDLMRVTISDSGRFIFKQRGPIERRRIIGTLVMGDMSTDYKVLADGHTHRILPAAVSFHKAKPGDEVVILVPKNAPSKWAAVEHIMKKAETSWE